MESTIVCAASDSVLSDRSLSLQNSSFFLVAQSDELSDLASVVANIIRLNPRHIFICGDHWKAVENVILDEVANLENRNFLFSTYDKLDYDSVWDFLYLNRFEFVEKYKVFLPLCKKNEQILQISANFFALLAKAISDNA